MIKKFKLKNYEDIIEDNPFRILIHNDFNALVPAYLEIVAGRVELKFFEFNLKREYMDEHMPFVMFFLDENGKGKPVVMNEEYLTINGFDAFVDCEDGNMEVFVKGEDYGKEEEVKNEVQ